MAFYRNCKSCGATLSFRKMPAGQWVAFDVTADVPHECFSETNVKGKGGYQKSRVNPIFKEQVGPAAASVATLEIKDVRGSTLSVLKRAIQESHDVVIDYFTEGRRSRRTRRVSPKVIVNLYGSICVRAYCHWREEERTFKVANIRSIQLSPHVVGKRVSVTPRSTQQEYSHKVSKAHSSKIPWGMIWWIVVGSYVISQLFSDF